MTTPDLLPQIAPARSLAEMQKQRQELQQYIQAELRLGVDFGMIPGTKNRTLLKPGAEKLLNLFGLGSRIVDKKREILEGGAIIVDYTVEVYHLKSGLVICQCEGSANSQEKKYKDRQPMDNLNTLMKMAQKRALVGATVLATHASDYFAKENEDYRPQPSAAPQAGPASQAGNCEVCGAVLRLTKKADAYYCPNYEDKSQGDHTYRKIETGGAV